MPRYYFGIDDQEILDKAAERTKELLDMPLDTLELKPSELIRLVTSLRQFEVAEKEVSKSPQDDIEPSGKTLSEVFSEDKEDDNADKVSE